MLTKRKKLSKKEIKQDKLVETYYKLYGFFEENSQRLLLYGGILVVLVFAIIFYVNNKKQKNETAGVELAKVMDSYDKGNYVEAIQGVPGTSNIGLKKIVDEYGSTENGETAKIYLANSYMFQGKTDEAYNVYKDYSGSINMYKATALAGQAAHFVDKKDFKKAADLYVKAARVSDTDVLNPNYLLKAGINYMKSGNNTDAKALFEKVQDNYKNSSAAREVPRYIAQVDQN